MRTKMNDGDNVNDDDDHVDIISLLACCKIKSVWAFTFTFQNSNFGNSFCFLQSPLNCAAWWPENQPWQLKYKLMTDLTHVLSVISHSCNLCGYSTTSASKLKRHMLWFTEANPAWLWDFLKHEIEKGLRAVQFTLERSLLFANSATSPAHQLGASRYTCSYTREGNPVLAHNAATHVHKLMTSKNTCSPIQERSLLFI